MKAWVLLAAASMTLLAMSARAAPQRSRELLVVEKGKANLLAIVDPVRLKVLAQIPVGTDPHEVAASSDGTRAYVSNYGGLGSNLDTIARVNLLTRTPLRPIRLGALHSAHGLDFAGGELYFTAETNRVVGRYDPATHSLDWIMGTGEARTHMIQTAKDLQRVFASNPIPGTISIIEKERVSAPGRGSLAHTSWDVTNVRSGRGAEGFDVSPDGRQIWAANADDDSVTVIDVLTKKAIETFPIPVRRANRLKFTPDGRYVLISGLGGRGAAMAVGSLNNLAVLDARTHRVVKRLDLGAGAGGILMDAAGSRAFVAVSGGDGVAVIDLDRLTVSAVIKGLQAPDGMTWALVPNR